MTAALLAILFFAFAVQATIGFGGTLLALAIGGLLLPVPELLPMVSPASVALSVWILWRDRGALDARLLLRTILPLMGLGLVPGFWLSGELSAAELKMFLGVVVLAAAARGLVVTLSSSQTQTAQPPMRSWIFGAGVVHGMIATGGPPLVYALSGSALDKRAFRATLAAVWLIMDIVLTVRFSFIGTFDAEVARFLLLAVPSIVLAAWIGGALHRRLDAHSFRVAVYVLLALTGGVQVALSLGSLLRA